MNKIHIKIEKRGGLRRKIKKFHWWKGGFSSPFSLKRLIQAEYFLSRGR